MDSLNELCRKIFKLNKCFLKPINELIMNEINKNFISTKNIKQQIFEIFEIKEIKDDYFYEKLLIILRDSDIKKEKIIIPFIDLINLYIKHKIILINENEEIKKNTTDYIINTISAFVFESTLQFFENYISCFQIKGMIKI